MQSRLTAAPKGYFGTYDIPIVRGRDFETGEYSHASDDPSRPLAVDRAIIGSDLARRLWGDANPLGRRLTMAFSEPSNSPALVVVGVVNDASATASLGDQVHVYVPYSPINTGVIARTAGPALPMLNAMRRVVTAEAPQLPIRRAQTMEQREAESRRSILRTSGAVAGADCWRCCCPRSDSTRSCRWRSGSARERSGFGRRSVRGAVRLFRCSSRRASL